MPRTLKVFRTGIGFHDAYVAAPSQKAALEAWGSDANLFGRGLAEAVTDPELTAEPLARPGDVIKRLRGTEEEHLAALDEGTETARPSPKKAPPTRKKKVQPRPDRKALDQAEEALDAAEREAAKVSERFRERERQLAREREAAQRTATDAAKRARRARDTERERYSRALERWRNR